MVNPSRLADPAVVDAIRVILPSPQSILVTGASGFIGSRLANTLAAAGHRVTGMGRNPHPASLDPRIDFRRADLRDATHVLAVNPNGAVFGVIEPE